VDWTTSALMFASERFMAYALIRMGFQRAFRVTYRDRLIIRILDENTISHNLHDTAAMLADQRPQNYFAALPQRCTSRRPAGVWKAIRNTHLCGSAGNGNGQSSDRYKAQGCRSRRARGKSASGHEFRLSNGKVAP
jgi:hypothetical protein